MLHSLHRFPPFNKKNNKHYTKLSHRINSELITTSKFPFKNLFVNDKMTKKTNDFRQYESDEHI
jgi:hypothetical protein